MPWAERIEEVPLTGAVITLVDNTEVINRELALWNRLQGWPPFPSSGMGAGGTSAAGGAGGASAAGGSSAGGTSAMGGASAAGGTRAARFIARGGRRGLRLRPDRRGGEQWFLARNRGRWARFDAAAQAGRLVSAFAFLGPETSRRLSMRISFGKLWILPFAGSALLAPRSASACGGTFCDSGPTAMPVDQTGENVLFVMDGQNVEAHVQIQYTGEAARFAWLVPMPQIPTVSVGSQPLFTALLGATVPTYGFSNSFDQCNNRGIPSAGAGASGASGGGGMGGGAGDPGSGPTVVFKKTVGAFEVTVLQGGTAEEVSTWLSTNGYQSIPSAPAILQDYVEKNFVFTAIKLTGGTGVDEIHPLVFKYPGTEPCVPLKLTAVAAVEDMGVRVFFLGDDRVFPTNYKHVTLNPARIDWQSRATNYTQVMNRAADSAVANGKAFVTEYAGPSAAVGVSNNVFDPIWSDAPFVTMLPEGVIDELTRQRLACLFAPDSVNSTTRWSCRSAAVLARAAGIDEGTFYASLQLYANRIDRAKWQGAAFAADFKARIVDPGKHARDVVDPLAVPHPHVHHDLAR